MNEINKAAVKHHLKLLIVDRPHYSTTSLAPGFTLKDVIDEVNQLGNDTLKTWIQQLSFIPKEKITQHNAKWEVQNLSNLS